MLPRFLGERMKSPRPFIFSRDLYYVFCYLGISPAGNVILVVMSESVPKVC